MNSKLSVLFLTDFVPSVHAGNAGGQMFAYYIQELLQRGYNISFIALVNAYERYLVNDLHDQVDYHQVIPISRNLFARAGRLLRWVVDPAEYALIHDSKINNALLEVLQRRRFDIVHAVHPWLIHAAWTATQRLPSSARPALVGHVMDISAVLRLQRAYAAPRRMRPFHLFDFARVAFRELFDYSLADCLIVHNIKDIELINLLSPKPISMCLSPVWFDAINSIVDKYKKREKDKLLLVGNFYDSRTIEGATWLIKEIIPLASSVLDRKIELDLISVNNPEFINTFCNKEYIKCYTYKKLDEFISLYDLASVFVFPLLRGRYSRHIKVLNAFARGLPVVMTSWANSGAEAIPGEEALIADTPEDFADCIVRLFQDPALAARIAEGGLRRIHREYPSPSVVLDSLERAYQTAITQKEYRR